LFLINKQKVAQLIFITYFYRGLGACLNWYLLIQNNDKEENKIAEEK
jgi:hypothetical protein